MTRRRAIALSGLAAAILVNYWIVAPIIGVDHDQGFSWISDLAARGEAGGWRFALLDALSGIAVAGFGLFLWLELVRPVEPAGAASAVPQPGISVSGTAVTAAPGGSALRWGLILLIASGVLAIADALLPVSCARSLGAGSSAPATSSTTCTSSRARSPSSPPAPRWRWSGSVSGAAVGRAGWRRSACSPASPSCCSVA